MLRLAPLRRLRASFRSFAEAPKVYRQRLLDGTEEILTEDWGYETHAKAARKSLRSPLARLRSCKE